MVSSETLTPALIHMSLTAALIAAPYGFTYNGPSKGFLPQTAAAQSASEGSDTGSGDASPSSGESSSESTDTGAVGTGDPETTGPSDTGQDDDGPLGSGSLTDPGGAVEGTSDGVIEQDGSAEPAQDGNTGEAEPIQQQPAAVRAEEPTVEVRYSNGMREEIRDGRYEMTDLHGRIIINRPATESDYERLLTLAQ